MSVVADTVATASGLLKTVYAEGVTDALPENELITKIIGYQKFEKIGKEFQCAVNLSYGHSVTAIGDKDQVLSLGVPSIIPIVNANASSYVFVYRDILSATIMQRASAESPQAFASASSVALERARKSFTKIQEEVLNYGGLGLAQFTAATADLNNVQVTILNAEFAPGIWVGAKDMPIDIYSSAGLLILQTIVTSIPDLSTRKLTLASVTGLVNGTTYTIWRRGFRGMEGPGLQSILTNNTNLFGIDASGTYDLWTPSIRDLSSAALVFAKVARGVAIFRPKGLAQNLKLIVSEDAFIDAIPDYNSTTETNASPGPRASRVFMGKDDVLKLVHGSAELTYKINTSSVEIMSSPYQKNGYAPLVEADSLIRIGSSEKAFTFMEVGGADRYFRLLENMNAYEFRLMSDIALFTAERNKNMIFKNILPNTAV